MGKHDPNGPLTMIVSLEAIFLSTFVMISQHRADQKPQVLTDHQWQTVREEERQNQQLLKPQPDCQHENSPPSPWSPPAVCLRRLSLCARGDRLGGPLDLGFGLSYRDLEELLTGRGVEVDHITVYRWVLRVTPLLAEAA